MTTKLKKLAEIIVGYSIKVQKGEKILLKGYGFDGYPLIKEIYRECLRAGAAKIDVRFSNSELSRIFLEEANDEQLTHVTKLDEEIADSYDAMVQIVADQNPYELIDADQKKIQKCHGASKKISDILHTKRWCLFYFPNLASAQTAKRSLDEWQDFVLDSCLLDWQALEKVEVKFIELMRAVKKVRIVGEETDLSLSIEGQKWKPCCGLRNLPDGEIFTAPVRDSVNGVIRYNTPSRYRSQDFDWVKLTLKDGKVVGEESNSPEALTEILNSDEGARYFGEFAFGLNNAVTKPTRQIIFDEKMGKSLHMALGKCYKECPNGNDSMIHWDLIFRFEQAGAELYFDDVKVYEKDRWIDERFTFLNELKV